MLYTDIRAVNPSQKLAFFITGTFTLLILEQGQLGALTLYPKWLCLVDKLNPKLYTVMCTLHTGLCMYQFTIALDSIQMNLQEYLTSRSSLFISNNKLVHPSYISPIWPNHVLYSIFGSECVCVVRHSFTLSSHLVTVRTT